MTPIQELLERIRWDAGFGEARFEVAYYDRLEKALLRVPLEKGGIAPSKRAFFVDIVAPDGAVHSVPLHRVRSVWRDGVLIWER